MKEFAGRTGNVASLLIVYR